MSDYTTDEIEDFCDKYIRTDLFETHLWVEFEGTVEADTEWYFVKTDDGGFFRVTSRMDGFLGLDSYKNEIEYEQAKRKTAQEAGYICDDEWNDHRYNPAQWCTKCCGSCRSTEK